MGESESFNGNIQYHAEICPNCNGRTTVGLNPIKPCPTCSHTDHPGIVYVPGPPHKKENKQ